MLTHFRSPSEKLDAGHARHPLVGDNQPDIVPFEHFEPFGSGSCAYYLVLKAEKPFEQA
jgi:hypothetical protein